MHQVGWCFVIIQEGMESIRSYYPVDFSCPVVADILCEFLEVAIHLILYVREVYPSGIFQKRKKYNVPVQVQMSTICSQFLGLPIILYV